MHLKKYILQCNKGVITIQCKMVHEWNTSTKYWTNCSFPVKCECGKEIQSNSLFNHRKSKAHILEILAWQELNS